MGWVDLSYEAPRDGPIDLREGGQCAHQPAVAERALLDVRGRDFSTKQPHCFTLFSERRTKNAVRTRSKQLGGGLWKGGGGGDVASLLSS